MKCLYVIAFAALTAVVSSRTPAPVAPGITSLTDKEARTKASKHPAFANAGRRPGLEVWRIRDLNPESVPQKDFGIFYIGDSYIVLNTTADKKHKLSWDIYYWIGSKSTQDESGAAAVLTVGLDVKFGGAAVQYREVQGQETQQFKDQFSSIEYQSGGYVTEFKQATNARVEKRLFHVKGKTNVGVRQVGPQIAYMNKGDCFILDVNPDIYVYLDEKVRHVEKTKCLSVANQINGQDHYGSAAVKIVDQHSSDKDVDNFFTALGSGAKNLVPEESAGGDDLAFERKEERDLALFEVSCSEYSSSQFMVSIGQMHKPLKQKELDPQKCYTLLTKTNIYLWVGKESIEKEEEKAMKLAKLNFDDSPAWAKITKVLPGSEPVVFKQFFDQWLENAM